MCSNLFSGTTIQEQTELVKILPMIAPSKANYYSPPLLNSTFPQIADKQTIPKIHVSGKLPGIQSEADLCDLQWSHPIDLLVAADNFVTLPGVADVKIHVQQVAMVTQVTISPITKADVSAKEIRSRLTGKDRTITVSNQTDVKESAFVKESKQNFESKPGKVDDSREALLAKKKVKEKQISKASPRLSFGVFMNKITFIVLEEVSTVNVKNEIIRLTLEDVFMATYPVSELVEQPSYHRNCVVFSIGDLQLDNQVQSSGNFDFSVVLVRQNFEKPVKSHDLAQLYQMTLLEKHAVLKASSLLHVQVVFGSLNNRTSVIETVECITKPVNFYIDDTFIFHCIKEVGYFLPVPLSRQEPLPVSVLKLPSQVKSISKTLSCPVVIGHLLIQPLSVLFSIHASMKIFIASDHTPLSFGKFEKIHLCTTSYQLTRALAMHYASGALFRAGRFTVTFISFDENKNCIHTVIFSTFLEQWWYQSLLQLLTKKTF